jgi:ABC-2 type transport system ATP-binding protein
VGLLHEGRIIVEGEPSVLAEQLEDEVYALSGGDREALERALHGRPFVLATSPHGSRLRVVVAKATGAQLAALASQHGARAERVPPSFEDLFLSRVAAHGEAA